MYDDSIDKRSHQIITDVHFFYSFQPEFNTMHLPDFSIPKLTHDKSQEPLFINCD